MVIKLAVMTNPLTNRGTAFTREERAKLGLVGRLPAAVETLDQQAARSYAQLQSYGSDMEKYVYLDQLHDRNEVLYYKVLGDHLAELLPVVYDPTVGEAIKKWSRDYRRSRAVYLSIDHIDDVETSFETLGLGPDDIDLIVVSDAEQILGIGDWGVNGTDISVGKLAVYTAAAGIDPARTIAVNLDCGTNNEALLNDPSYLGNRHSRVRGKQYDEFIETYLRVAAEKFPHADERGHDPPHSSRPDSGGARQHARAGAVHAGAGRRQRRGFGAVHRDDGRADPGVPISVPGPPCRPSRPRTGGLISPFDGKEFHVLHHSSSTWQVAPSWLPSTLGWGLAGLVAMLVLAHTLRPSYRNAFGAKAPMSALRVVAASGFQLAYQTTALVVLTAPWWWAAGGLAVALRSSGVNPAADQTGLFMAGLTVWYLAFLATGFAGWHTRRRFRRARPTDERPAAVPRRVAVIGAGMAGLVAAKELREEGHDVTVYERTSTWGGVWADGKARGGRAWAWTTTSTGSLNTTLSDNPVPILHPENGDTPLHFTREQFLEMLTSYERRHAVLDDCLRTSTEVTSIDQLSGGRWRVTSRDPDGIDQLDEYDAVTLCTGLNHDPWIPTLPGADEYVGTALHVDEYDRLDKAVLAGATVVVLGTGETASDLVTDLVRHDTAHVHVARRGSTLILPRNFGSIPPDHPENRLVYSGPMANRWALLLSSLPVMLTRVLSPSRVPVHRARHWFRMLNPANTIRAFPAVLGSVGTTKSDDLWFALDTGAASLTGPVTALTSKGVRLHEGTEIDADAVIYCTGYRPSVGLLAAPGATQNAAPLSARQLFKLTVHPTLPGIAVIGYARGLIGAITVSTEMQARWWALIVSGKRTLPSPAAMQADVDRLARRSRRFAQPTRTTMTFANSLARHEVGCEPDLFRLFRRDPRLWWRVWNGPICNAHYRLDGVHARPDTAREQLMMPGNPGTAEYADGADVFYNLIPLALLSIPLWAAYRALLRPLGWRSALDSYV